MYNFSESSKSRIAKIRRAAVWPPLICAVNTYRLWQASLRAFTLIHASSYTVRKLYKLHVRAKLHLQATHKAVRCAIYDWEHMWCKILINMWIHGYRREQGGLGHPWILKFSAKKDCFLSFKWKNQISPLLPPLEKILLTPMCGYVYTRCSAVWIFRKEKSLINGLFRNWYSRQLFSSETSRLNSNSVYMHCKFPCMETWPRLS